MNIALIVIVRQPLIVSRLLTIGGVKIGQQVTGMGLSGPPNGRPISMTPVLSKVFKRLVSSFWSSYTE